MRDTEKTLAQMTHSQTAAVGTSVIICRLSQSNPVLAAHAVWHVMGLTFMTWHETLHLSKAFLAIKPWGVDSFLNVCICEGTN